MQHRNHRLSGAATAALAAVAMSMATVVQAEQAADSHARHTVKLTDAVMRSVARYATPPVSLVRADGKRVILADELDDGRPVVLDFIYTTCSSVCPVSSQTLAALQDQLGAQRQQVHIVSISIDPEEDTPSRLEQYARHVHAGPQWQFYTGTVQASQAVQRAFGVYSGDKMSHRAFTLVRPSPGAAWVRLDGFATVGELLAELPGPNAVR